MPKKITNEDYLSRARAVHGDKYDYSHTVYQNMHTKVAIICPVHGEFLQEAQAHLVGQGCPECGKEKQKQSVIDRYGVDNPMKSKEVCAKARQTCLEKYGTEWAMSTKAVRDKVCTTNMERYGAENPIQNETIHRKMLDTTVSRYGVENVSQSPEIRARAKQTCLERYGTEEPLSAKSVREKIKETNFERYNGPAPMSSPEIRQKCADTVFEKYHKPYVFQTESVIAKTRTSKSENHTFSSSSSEDQLYDILCLVFGTNNVKRNYTSVKYPYACDFYIVSRDMYIELNALWTHGHHWFNPERDAELIQKWSSKHTVYYDNAVHVWSESDVEKRECARKNHLNYVVFWDSKLRDANLWLASNCPDAHDYDHEYSWLPERNISAVGERDHMCTSSPDLDFSLVAKDYQTDVFYKHEIQLWNENNLFRTMILQMWLYCNRYEYLGKLPERLTDRELLRGFTISGIRKGYTGFNTRLMDEIVQKYGFKSIYDPCAGWGERFLYCAIHELEYHGVDVNRDLIPGYENLVRDFGTGMQHVDFADSAGYVPDFAADAVITCPPYGNTEIYTEYGAENLDETEFLNWWDRVVANSLRTGCRYFCFQINQKWKARMTGIVSRHGFTLEEELHFAVKGSHFTKNKREYESMIVMKKY